MHLRGSMIALAALAALAALGACQANPNDNGGANTPEPEPSQAAEPDQNVSILRPDIEQPDLPEAPLKALEAVIGFPDGGSELDTAAEKVLREVLGSEQIKRGGPIVLKAHSDAGGSDRVNQRVSRVRAEAVRGWLMDAGIAEDRIAIIIFGEQNPIEPNALPDGKPNETGRALNRRVEVLIVPPEENPGEAAG